MGTRTAGSAGCSEAWSYRRGSGVQAFCRRQNLELDGLGLPSLIGMDKLTLRGRFHFQDGAVLRGTLLMENDSDETKEILPGVYAGA